MSEKGTAAQSAAPPVAEDAPDKARTVSRIVALVDSPVASDAREFTSGRRVSLEEGAEDRVTVTNPEGQVELSVRFTAAGPVLTFGAAAIDLKTKGRINLDCGKLNIRSRHGIEMETGGDLIQKVDGRHALLVERGSTTEAYAVEIRSTHGDVRVKANDDARIDAERVLLNS